MTVSRLATVRTPRPTSDVFEVKTWVTPAPVPNCETALIERPAAARTTVELPLAPKVALAPLTASRPDWTSIRPDQSVFAAVEARKVFQMPDLTKVPDPRSELFRFSTALPTWKAAESLTSSGAAMV